MHITFFLARHFLFSRHQETSIAFMIKICFLSIAVSTCAFTLIIGIMQGFKYATTEKLQSVQSDIIISAGGKPLDYERIKQIVTQEFATAIQAISPSTVWHAIAQHDTKHTDLDAVCMIKGIDPSQERLTSRLEQMISSPEKAPLAQVIHGNSILIGKNLADYLGVEKGDTITLLYSPVANQKHASLESTTVTIGGIFKTGVYEYDEHVLYMSLDLFLSLFDTGITTINLKTKSFANEPALLEKLKARFQSLQVQSWKELYPSILSALTLESYATSLILILVIILASITIIALLFMYITHKYHTIALLKSQGMSTNTLIATFLMLAFLISGLATIAGILSALLIALFLIHYPLITLPDIYYVTHIPIHLTWYNIVVIITSTLAISLAAALIPCLKIKNISISQLIKQEIG